MPTETDLIEQLRSYGAWLQDQAPTSERVERDGPHATVDVTLDAPGVTLAERRGRTLIWLVAAALIAVCAAGLLVANIDSSAPADRPVDVPLAIYVVPDDDTKVLNPSFTDGPLRPMAGLVVGRRSGAGYDNPVQVNVTETAPDRSSGTWSDLDLETGPGIVEEPVVGWVRIAQQRGDRWIVATAAAGDGQRERVAYVVDHVTLTPDGTPQLNDHSVESVIATYASDLQETGRSTYMELPNDIVVETAPTVHPLAIPPLADQVEPTTIHDTDAWHLSGHRPGEGTWHAIVWTAAPNRVIAVSGTTDYDDIVSAAEELTVTDLHRWRERVGPLTN